MIIKWWTGTDALKLHMYPPGKFIWRFRIFGERLFWRTFHSWFDQHWVNTPKLIPYLTGIGIPEEKIKHVEVPWEKKRYLKREQHEGFELFNVLFYVAKSHDGNQKYKDWIYGRKIYNGLLARQYASPFRLIFADGSANMDEVFPFTDAYIKVMRHPGSDKNRIAKQCEYNKIPVFYTDYQLSDSENVERSIQWILELSR